MLLDALTELEAAHHGRVFGKYAGKVVGNSDSQKIGRLEVTCGAVLGDAVVWAMPCVPYAGPNVGMHFIPPVKAGVWIEFEGGDVSRPIWSGCYWSKGDLPGDATSADVKLIATGQASFKIDDGSAEVELANSNMAKTTWAMDVVTEGGQAKHSVAATGVTSESATGAGKVQVTEGGVVINNGKMAVAVT